jgi:hypothetical protein
MCFVASAPLNTRLKSLLTELETSKIWLHDDETIQTSHSVNFAHAHSIPSCGLKSRGCCRSVILAQFYKDLVDPRYKSRFAIYHRRFSTNTMPRWPLAQPFR